MKYYIRHILSNVWLLLLLLVLGVGLAVAQPDVVPAEAPTFPLILLVPYLIGTVIHWLKKWTETKLQTGTGISFGTWFGKDIVMTLVGLVAGVSTLWALFTANPEFYLAGNLGVWIQVIITGIAGDTLNTVNTSKT